MRRVRFTSPPSGDLVYDFVVRYVESRRYAPTLREIADACYLSKTAVFYHLRVLRAEGSLTLLPRRTRGIRLVR